MKIPIYLHCDVKNTIFQAENTRRLMEELGIEFAVDPAHAVLLVANNERRIRDLISKFKDEKEYLLWTHEPRFWERNEQWAKICGQNIRTITVHSGEVFRNNYYYLQIARGDWEPVPAPESINLRRRIICVAGAAQKEAKKFSPIGKSTDLTQLRTEIALAGHAQGKLDVFGRGWPQGVSRGESRTGKWSVAKYKILLKYHFNLCFENTLFPYYCSEKIWQAIYCGCLPIYFGQPTIYEDFPSESFIDYRDIGDPQALFKKVDCMTSTEFSERYNRCLEVVHRVESISNKARLYVAEYTVKEIRKLVD